MKCGIIAATLIVFGIGYARALDITSMEGKKAKRDFEFSKTVFIRGIKLENGFLKMPLDGYKTKRYSNIKILSKSFYSKLLNCFKGKQCALSAKRKAVSVKVEKIFPLKSPLRIANVNLSFDDDIIITFGMVKSEVRGKKRQQREKTDNEIWISYPKDFEIKNEIFKRKVEKLIKREFKKFRHDSGK